MKNCTGLSLDEHTKLLKYIATRCSWNNNMSYSKDNPHIIIKYIESQMDTRRNQIWRITFRTVYYASEYIEKLSSGGNFAVFSVHDIRDNMTMKEQLQHFFTHPQEWENISQVPGPFDEPQ